MDLRFALLVIGHRLNITGVASLCFSMRRQLKCAMYIDHL